MNLSKKQKRSSPITLSEAGGEPTEEKLETYLAEYVALREEIKWLVQEAGQYQNFAIVVIGATLSLVPWVLDKAPMLLTPVLLIVPFVFSLLGFLYLREHEEVYVVAAYLREYLRPQVRLLIKDREAWGWEEFKDKRSREVFSGDVLRFLSTTRIIVILRSSLFLLPSTISLLFILASTDYQYILNHFKEHFLTYVLLAIWFILDALVVVLLILHMWGQGDFPKRILKLNSTQNVGDLVATSPEQVSSAQPITESIN